jgi:hypothetical protein
MSRRLKHQSKSSVVVGPYILEAALGRHEIAFIVFGEDWAHAVGLSSLLREVAIGLVLVPGLALGLAG